MDHQSRPSVRKKKRARDRLIRLAQRHPAWAVGFADETWWSRLAQPALHSWAEAEQPLRLVEQTVAKDDPDPKAVACYGLLRPDRNRVWLRFVAGRPVSAITTQFLADCCQRLESEGKTALLLIWDNASWHVSQEVRRWLRAHNREVKHTGQGVRILPCFLPIKSPWLNRIEPHWTHAQKAVVEPDRLLSADELVQRVCDHFACTWEPHLAIPEKVA
jgi:DDE superfamily endonuclease